VTPQDWKQARDDAVTEGIRVLERAEAAEMKLRKATEQLAAAKGISVEEAQRIIDAALVSLAGERQET
jgi:hypothetical protein